MGMTKHLKIGDIFEVVLTDDTRGYLQYIANDQTQLNSDVVRVFGYEGRRDSSKNFESILESDIDFFAHVHDVKVGEKDNLWNKIGNSNNLGDLTKAPLFRRTMQHGVKDLVYADKWDIWLLNKPMRATKGTDKLLSKSHIGLIFPTHHVVERMKNGKYPFFYPKFNGEL
jgi:hypothetical protein